MERGVDGVGALGISWAQNTAWARALSNTAWYLWIILDTVRRTIVDQYGWRGLFLQRTMELKLLTNFARFVLIRRFE